MTTDRVYEFRLVADALQPPISIENWQALRALILHLQPARPSTLEGDSRALSDSRDSAEARDDGNVRLHPAGWIGSNEGHRSG
jgi:hypothetical protein